MVVIAADGSVKPETVEGYVRMSHGEVYALGLASKSNLYSGVQVFIDGLDMGKDEGGSSWWQLEPYNRLVKLERPAAAKKNFTFFKAGSAEFKAIGAEGVESKDMGLIQVKFIPGRKKEAPIRLGCFDSGVMRGGSDIFSGSVSKGVVFGAGASGLSGHSNQEFKEGIGLIYNHDNAVTISLRLVHDASPDIQPLPGRIVGNPVPPPVGS